MGRFFAAIGFAIVVLVAILVIRTATLSPPKLTGGAATPVPAVNAMDVARHLSDAVRFRTVSYGDHVREADKNAELDRMRAWMERTYPNFHRVAEREIVGKSLVFTWKGTNAKRSPILLMAHMDVVPVVPGTESKWMHQPFSGDIAGGYVWGRGAIDDKGSLISILDAADRLAASGFTPARTIMFAFGQDEEVGGDEGNGTIAKLLARRGVHFGWVLDEGGTIQTEPYPGVSQPIAFIAVAEKGYLSLRLVAHGTPGHSSTPSKDLALARLAQAILAVVHHPFESGLDAVQRRKLAVIAPYAPFGARMVLGNLWLTAPVVIGQMNETQDGAARLHTTIAPTMLSAGIKDNVIPPDATAVVNFRLNPRDTIASVVEHVKNSIDDPGVDVVVMTETREEASKVSDIDGGPYHFLQHEVSASFGGIPVAPDSTTGATDSRHYLPIADAVFRLDPFQFARSDLTRVHGTDERLSVADLGAAVTFYMRLMKDVQ